MTPLTTPRWKHTHTYTDGRDRLQLRDPADRATLLHTALIEGRWNVAEDLIRSTTDERLLDEVYDVTGTNSSKSLQ